MSDDNTMVAIRGLSKHFGSTQALDNVNLDIERGRIIGLLGANGGGQEHAAAPRHRAVPARSWLVHDPGL